MFSCVGDQTLYINPGDMYIVKYYSNAIILLAIIQKLLL